LRIYYRRSTDGGKTFGARKLLHSTAYVPADQVDNSHNLKRLAVDGNYVHVVTTTGGGAVTVRYLRSADNGVTFTSKVLYFANHYYRSEHVLVDAAGGRVAVAWQRRYIDWDGGYYDNQSWIKVRTSGDNGATFAPAKQIAYTGPAVGDTLRMADLKVMDDGAGGENVYVLYTNIVPNQFHVWLAASHDNGASFQKKLLQASSTQPWSPYRDLQDNNYVPKMAAVGTNLYVTWSAYNNAEPTPQVRAYFRRSTDSGATFGPVLNLSGALPEGRNAKLGEETVAAQGSNVYVVFVGVDVNGNYPKVYLRRSTDSGVSFGAFKTLSTINSDFSGWLWPRVMTQPGDATGAKMHALWNYPTYVSSANAGAAVTSPVWLYPRYAVYDWYRPRMAVGADGVLHWVAEGNYNVGGNIGDQDIFYRRLDPPATPAATPKYLYLVTDDSWPYTTKRYDNLQIAASTYINFTGAMTAEAWIKPDTTGNGFFVYRSGCYQLGEYYGHAYAEIYNTDGIRFQLEAAATLPNNVWSHVAMTYKAAAAGDNLKLYVNGELVDSTQAEGNLQTTNDPLLVNLQSPFTPSLGIYELRFWNVARTQQQIENNMDNDLVGTEVGLKAYLPLNGSTLDKTGHGNNGILMYKETFLDR
jgi:hypothetical protein